MKRHERGAVDSARAISRRDLLSLTAKGMAGVALLGAAGDGLARTAEGPPSLVGHVISHTHWDRAWYLPFEQFRLRLVKLMQKLLPLLEQDPSYKFNLDGQTIIVEDFLQICPRERGRIEKLVRNGQLAVGPFYVQPDQFLVSGESLIRNMMIGIRQAQELGGVQLEGYLADNFGHPAQLPQLLQGFHIRSLLTNVSRGVPKERFEDGWVQRWFAPDGVSSVCAYFMEGYANFYYWGFDNFDPKAYPTLPPDANGWSLEIAAKQLEDAVNVYRTKTRLDTREIFLGNGVDHQEAQPHVPWLIAELNRRQDKIHLVHSSCRELIDAVLAEGRALPELRGPLGDDRLFGTMTSRVYLHQDYTRIAAGIEMLAEPLLSLVHVYGAGHRVFREPQHHGYTFNPGQNWPEFPWYPQGQMEYLWKLLLQNAPHDDLSSCSVDATHRDMEDRFKRSAEVTDALWNDALLVLAGRLLEQEPDGVLPKLVVFNPHPFVCSEKLLARLALPGLDDPEQIGIVDGRGQELPAAVASAQAAEYPLFDGNDFNKDMTFEGLEAEVAFRPSLPPCSFSVFSVVTRGRSPVARHANEGASTVREADGVVDVENDYCRIRLSPNGTFDVYDKELQRTFPGLGRLEDVEDVGDTYRFRRFQERVPPFTSANAAGRVRTVAHDSLSTTVEVRFALPLPVSLDAERKARKTELVDNPVKMVFEIPHYRKGGRVTVDLENRAKDHHLFMYFPSRIRTDRFLYDCKFDFAAYPVGYEKARLDSVVIADSGNEAFGLVLDCPTIVASRAGAGGEAEFGWSLVRAVDHVNADIPLKHWAAHEAQCLRRITRRMEWCTGRPDDVRAAAWQLRRTLQAPPPVCAVTPAAKRRYLDDKHSVLPLGTEPLLETDDGSVHLSCWKRAEDGEAWVVRLYSLAERQVRCRLKTRLPVKGCWIADLNETPTRRLAGSPTQGFTLEFGPKEIKTLRLELDREVIDRHLARKGTAGAE